MIVSFGVVLPAADPLNPEGTCAVLMETYRADSLFITRVSQCLSLVDAEEDWFFKTHHVVFKFPWW